MGTGHDHAPAAGADHRRRLGIAFGITASILVVEVIGAAVTGSLSLLVDAAHMLTDAGGLFMALVAASLVRRAATPRRTWGFQRAEVLAATAQAAVLLAVGLFALVEGVRRLVEPPAVPSAELLIFGVVGLVGNIASIAVLTAGRSADLNMRAAFLEVVNDALGSLAVIASAVIIMTTGWGRADALAGMLIAVLIIPRTIELLRETTDVLLESTPAGLDLDDVRAHMLELPHVTEVHDLHASLVGTGLPILSAHVTVEDSCFRDGHAPEILDDLQKCVAEHFSIKVEHSTFQIEPAQHAQHERHTHA